MPLTRPSHSRSTLSHGSRTAAQCRPAPTCCPPPLWRHPPGLPEEKKKSGGLRPIAVGEVLRRLTSKCLSHAVLDDALQSLVPLQVGVGVRGGCEAIVHSVAGTLEDASIPSIDRWTLLLDFRNAFNSVSRKHIFEEVRARTPAMSAWIECGYGSMPLLHLGEDTIKSKCGVQQGDPLGPLGFALVLQPIIEHIKREVPGLKINAWYLDDGTLVSSPPDLLGCSADS